LRSWSAPLITAALLAWASLLPGAAGAATLDPQALASSLQSDPVQSIGVPRSSFSWLSRGQIRALRREIASFDPGRMWILVVSPRSDAALGNIADPAFAKLPAGTLIAVAEDPKNPNTTNWYVGSTWESSDAAQNQLNNVIQGFQKGQGSLFDDLRLEIRSFARGDAAAGHPALNSGNSGGQATGSGNTGSAPSVSTGSGSSAAGLITALIVVGVLLVVVGIPGVRYLRGARRASHWHKEEVADAHEQAKTDLTTLGEKIEALDIDSSMPGASAAAKDEYASALQCYEEAGKRMEHGDDDYQFAHAVDAIKRGLEHVGNADRLFNSRRTTGPRHQ
jgi:hypothetical protein